jgi:hypothetical protein
LGCAERGVFDTEVGAVERAEVVDAELGVGVYGVYGEARGCGEPSIILALLGGTSGGVDSDLNLVEDD